MEINHQQHDLLALALRTSNINYWEYDLEKHICRQAGEISDLFGVPTVVENFPEEAIKHELFDKECQESLWQLDREVREGKQGASTEIHLKTKDGVMRWYRITYTSLFDDNQKPYWSVGIATEITQQKEMEVRYQEEMLYHEVLDDNLLGSFRINLTKLMVEEVKIAGEIQYEYSGAGLTLDIYEKLLKHVTLPEEKKKFLKIFQREKLLAAYAEGNIKTEYEHHIVTENGSNRFVNTKGIMTKRPGADEIILFVYTRVVENQQLAENILNSVAAQDYDYFLIIDGVNNSYIKYTGNGISNQNAETGINYDASRIRGVYQEVIEEEQDNCLMETALVNVYRQLEKNNRYITYATKKGSEGEKRRKKLTYFYIDKQSRILVLTCTDVTQIFREEQRKNDLLKDALKAAEFANAAKGEFLSKMSHEIRTPMNAILGLASLAKKETDMDRVKEELDKIDISAKFLLSLLNDILDMSRIESGKETLNEERIEMGEFLREINTIIRGQAAEKNILYSCETRGRTEGAYMGDPLKLQQVLLNILGNAVKFTPNGGKITFSIEQLRQSDDMATLRFVIRDTGIGIKEDFMPHLFEPFSQEHTGITTAYNGTGLGLAICQNIVNMMNGKITVKSQTGRGTEFVVDVMIHRCNRNMSGDSNCIEESPEVFDFTGKRALVVEDNSINQKITRELLEEVGFIVETADNGSEAVDLFWKNEVGHYDIILMDVRMPVMDGLSASINIRGLEKPDSLTIPIIAITANAFAEDKEKSKASGMNAHLSKPVDTIEMYRVLARFV